MLADVQDLARQRTGDAIETLAKIMANEKAPLRRASRLPRCCSIALCQASTAHRTDARRLDPTALNDDELAAIAAGNAYPSRAGEMPRRTRHPPCNR